MRPVRWISLAAMLCVACALTVNAADDQEKPKGPPKCDRCGQTDCCLKKICKPVPIEVDKKEVCFDCKCEDFCVPGRSCLLDTICHNDACGCWVERVWKPTCAEVRTRNVMVKKEVTRKSQSFKWEMQHLCPSCACLPPAAKGTPPSGTQPGGTQPVPEEVEEMQPEDQSVEEEEISSLPPRGAVAVPLAAQAPAAPKRSFWAFWR